MSQVDIVVDLINKQDIVVDSSEISKTGAQKGLPIKINIYLLTTHARNIKMCFSFINDTLYMYLYYYIYNHAKTS